MRPARPTDRAAACAAIVAAVLTLPACGSMPSLTGGGSPFGSTSSIDRTFIGAAQTWDFDKDGTVTCDEWKNDAAEFAQMAKTDHLFTVADIGYYDANGDGKATVEELTGKQNAAFKLLDKNADCRIDRTESVRVLPTNAPKPSGGAPNTDQQIPGQGGPR